MHFRYKSLIIIICFSFGTYVSAQENASDEEPEGEENLETMMKETHLDRSTDYIKNEEKPKKPVKKKPEKKSKAQEEEASGEENGPDEGGGEETPSEKKSKTKEKTREDGTSEEGGDEDTMINKYVNLGGALEVEAFRKDDFFEDRTISDIVLETAELDFEITLVDWAKGLLSIEWEPDREVVRIKEGFITLGGTDCFPYFLIAGKIFIPFGMGTGAVTGDTLSVTDPLTIEIFESREDVIMIGEKWNGFHATLYIYNGDTNRRPRSDHIEQYGASLRYGIERPDSKFSFHAGFDMMSSVFDTDALSEEIPEALFADAIPGYALHMKYFNQGFSFIAEFNGAFRHTNVFIDEKHFWMAPKAWQIEFGYQKELYCRPTYVAFNYSHSYDLAGFFPQKRYLISVGRWIYEESILIAFEYGKDFDYSKSEGGTGRTAELYIAQLAYEW